MARAFALSTPATQAATTRLAPAPTLSVNSTAIGALLLVIAAIGKPVFAAGQALVDAGCAWAENRHQVIEDRKLRDLALSDPRVAADLIALGIDGSAR
jgi:hypothetical protein